MGIYLVVFQLRQVAPTTLGRQPQIAQFRHSRQTKYLAEWSLELEQGKCHQVRKPFLQVTTPKSELLAQRSNCDNLSGAGTWTRYYTYFRLGAGAGFDGRAGG